MSNNIVVNKVSVPQTIGPAVQQPTRHHARHAPSPLFDQSSFKQVAGAALPGGVSLPGLSQDQQQQISSLFGGLSDAGKEQVQSASTQLAGSIWQAIGITYPPTTSGQTDDSQQAGASAVGAAGSASGAVSTQAVVPGATDPSAGISLAAAGDVSRVAASIQTPADYTHNAALTQAVGQAGSVYASASGSNDPTKSVSAVTYMGLIGLQTDLADYAGVVHDQNARLQTARTQYQNLTDTVDHWPAGQSTVQFTWTDLDDKGNTVQNSGALTKDQAQAKADQLQNNTIPSLSSTNQIQQLQLQNLTQNYQQGVNTLSNVLKFEFDTQKSIISNIRTG